MDEYGVEKAIPFGVTAGNSQTRHSDIDLILIQPTERRFFDRYDGILQELCQALPGVEIDLLIYTLEEFANIQHRLFICKAVEQGQVIYEPGKIPA